MDHASISIDGLSRCALRHAEIVESLCTPGGIVAEVELDQSAPQPADMLGRWMSIDIPTLLEDRPTRWANGIITKWACVQGTHQGEGTTVYRLHASGPATLLALRRHARQFTDQSVKAIVDTVFGDWGSKVPFGPAGPMMVLDHEPSDVRLQSIRQTDETDLSFVTGLMNLSGMFTLQVNNGPGLSDTMIQQATLSRAADPWSKALRLRMDPLGAASQIDHRIGEWERHANLTPTIPVVSTWHPSVAKNATPSNASAMHAAPSSSDFKGWELLNHPLGTPMAGLMMSELRDRLSAVREQALLLEHHWRLGLSTSAAIVPGFTIDPAGLPDDDEGPFFVTATRLIVMGAAIGRGITLDSPLRCSFRAIPLETPFRPPTRPDRLEPPPLADVQLARGIQDHIAAGVER